MSVEVIVGVEVSSALSLIIASSQIKSANVSVAGSSARIGRWPFTAVCLLGASISSVITRGRLLNYNVAPRETRSLCCRSVGRE